MLTAEEHQELAALNKGVPQRNVAQSRAPSDLNIQPFGTGLTLEEEQELESLNQQFQDRPEPQAPTSESTLEQIGNAFDKYSGSASTRRAVGTLINTGNIGQAGSDFIDQFGQHPNVAPTGKELATDAGLSTENNQIPRSPMQIADDARSFKRPGESIDQSMERVKKTNEVYSPAGMVGLAADVALDPSSLIPFIPFAKIAGKTGSIALKGSAKAANAAEAFSGLPLTKIGDGLEVAGKSTAEALRKTKSSIAKAFKPGVADDFNDISRIAAENNIPSELLNEAHKYGENSVVSRAARNNAEGPLGGLEKHEQLQHAVSEATENSVKKITKTESFMDDAEAGALIRQAHDDGFDSFMSSMGETYGNAMKLSPGMQLDKKSSLILNDKLKKLEDWANKRIGDVGKQEKIMNSASASKKEIKNATSEALNIYSSENQAMTKTGISQAREVKNAVAIARSALERSGGDLSQVYSLMRDMGEIAFKSKNSLVEIPSDIAKFQESYFSFQKAMTESVRSHLGDEFADQLVKNNSEMSKFFTNRGHLNGVVGNKSFSDEQVFRSLIMNGDSKKLDALQSVISPEAYDKLRGTYIHRVIKPDANGLINFKAARKTLNELKIKGKLKLVMNDAEAVKLDEVLRVGERGGLGVLSTSGTGASGKFSDIAGYIKDKIAGDTLVDSIKNGTRANYVETTAKTVDGVDYVKLLKKEAAEKPKSGYQALKESSPVTKKQTLQATKIESINERNKKLQKLKTLRGA